MLNIQNIKAEDIANHRLFVYRVFLTSSATSATSTSQAPRPIYIGCDCFQKMASCTLSDNLTIIVDSAYDDVNEGVQYAKLLNEMEKPENTFRPKQQRIKCNELGVEFNSIREASRVLGVNPAAISGHLRGLPGYKKPKGFTFSYV